MMSGDSINWGNALNAALVLAAVINFFSAAFFWRMRATFVSQSDLQALEAKWDERLSSRDKETDADASDLEKRVRAVEVAHATIAGEIRNVGQIMTRVEHQVGLLVEYRLYESKHQ